MDGKLSKYKLGLSCSFMYLQLANLLLLNMCFEYQRAASGLVHSNRGTWKKIIQSTFFENKILTFFCKRTSNIHKYFEGCFVRGQVCSNGFLKSFQWLYHNMHSWTLNFIGPFAKKLENLLFSNNVVIG